MKNAKTMKIILSFVLLFNISMANIVSVFAEPETGPLTSLNVDDAPLSPSLNGEQREYSVALPEGTKQFNVEATASSEKAKITGTGKYDVDSSEEKVRVRVKEGSKTTTYTITVKITNSPILTIPYEDQELGFAVEKATDAIIPEGFSLTKSSYQGSDIRAYKNESLPIEIVRLQDSEGTSDWYCLMDGKITGRFNSFVFNKKKYYAIGVEENQKAQSGYVYGAYDILNTTVYGWKVDDEQYSSCYMLYLMDESGTPNYYVYDIQEKSLTDRRVFESKQDKASQGLPTVLIVALAVVIVGAMIFGIIIVSANKKRGQQKGQTQRPKVTPKNQSDMNTALVHTQKIQIYPKQEKVTDDDTSIQEKLAKAKKEKEKKRLEMIEKKRAEEIARKKRAEEKRRQEEEQKRLQEEQKRLQEAEEKRLQEEQKRLQALEEKKRSQLKEKEEAKKRNEEILKQTQMQVDEFEDDPMNEILAYIDNLFYHDK